MSTAKAEAGTVKGRIESIDLLRGIVMVIMAIDHIRDFFHLDSWLVSPTNIQLTTPGIFYTRWITHLCAPTFIFLAGTSAYFVARRKTVKETSFFLLTRGLWLVALQATLVRFAWTFDPLFHYNSSSIISTIGISMVVLSLLIRFKMNVILVFGLITVFGHNALDGIAFERGTIADVLWTFLHGPVTRYQLSNGYSFNFLFSLIPWVGVMALGYCFGQIFSSDLSIEKRRKILVLLGTTCLLTFTVLRFTNWYGDPSDWKVQPELVRSIMSFFNVTKYPPSLSFLMVTLGVSLLLLAALEGKSLKRWSPVTLFGKVAIFYYVMHLFVIHFFALVVVVWSGYSWKTMIMTGSPTGGSPDLIKQNFGFGLGGVYLIWVIVILTLYPLCVWWNKVKIRNKEKWWVSYV
ncbi:ribonuclease HI [Cytophagales bacterium WSM2-2]|nr:ribonuclease HI [Cytophagales bacterium WSM2-2]